MLGWRVIPRVGAGPLKISPHGVGIAFGVLVGSRLFARRMASKGLDPSHAWNIAGWGVAGAIVGARAAYVIGHASDFSSPLEWLAIWRGGISLIGGLLGGVASAWNYMRRHQLDFWTFADLGAPCLALGIALGRSGDLIIGDHLGKQTSRWWGWVYRGGELISPPPCLTPSGRHVYNSFDGCIMAGMRVHQTALYDALWSLVIFGLLTLAQRKLRRPGSVFLLWVSLYSLGRIATDFLRVDKRWILSLTGSQITSVLALCLAVSLLALGRPLGRRGPPPEVPQPAGVAG